MIFYFLLIVVLRCDYFFKVEVYKGNFFFELFVYVLIFVYNEEKVIEIMVRIVFNQDYYNFKLFLINDNFIDLMKEIMERIVFENLKRVVVIDVFFERGRSKLRVFNYIFELIEQLRDYFDYVFIFDVDYFLFFNVFCIFVGIMENVFEYVLGV